MKQAYFVIYLVADDFYKMSTLKTSKKRKRNIIRNEREYEHKNRWPETKQDDDVNNEITPL